VRQQASGERQIPLCDPGLDPEKSVFSLVYKTSGFVAGKYNPQITQISGSNLCICGYFGDYGRANLKLSTARIPDDTGSAVAVPIRTSTFTVFKVMPLLPFQFDHGS